MILEVNKYCLRSFEIFFDQILIFYFGEVYNTQRFV